MEIKTQLTISQLIAIKPESTDFILKMYSMETPVPFISPLISWNFAELQSDRDKETEWILSPISCDGITAKLHRWEIKISLKIFSIYYDRLSSIYITGTS